MNAAAIGVAIISMLLARYHAVLSSKHFLKIDSRVFGCYILYIGSLASTALLIYSDILSNKPDFEEVG
ncbi:hypothetical protein ANCCAN_18684 [Ancylostoma caninum]|uniref:Uncharacterized protein n=1 Tax=Ancylostoma caninum TaxID=29170 RepID=A0A368FT96_ANCCA|nr:hypothetical protein ANCCAN_18684 [Ancylostoma caninum]